MDTDFMRLVGVGYLYIPHCCISFFFNAKLEVDGKLCCKGELSFALVPVPAEEKQ